MGLNKNDQAIVLLSSGLDSTVNLYWAQKKAQVILAITFDYGQRAAQKEIEQSRKLCAHLNIAHEVVALPFFKSLSSSALIDRNKNLPSGGQVQIQDIKTSQDTARAVWVPNRNGIFLNIAAGFAEQLGAQYVIPGFNREEAATFADNSVDYMQALNNSFSYSTANKVQTFCFTACLDKTEIVNAAEALHVPLADLWPCYENGTMICGQCESCQRFLRAIEKSSARKQNSAPNLVEGAL